MTYALDRYLRIRGATAPSWSPDGKRLTYLTETTGVLQVWAVTVAEPIPQQLTFHDERVAAAGYSPVSNEIIYSMDSGGDENMQLFRVDDMGERPEPLTQDPASMHIFGGYSPDGKMIAFAANTRNKAFFDIYTMDLATRTVTLVFQGNGRYAVACWLDDASLILCRLESSFDHELYHLDLHTQKSRRLAPQAGSAVFLTVCPRPDGQSFYVLTDVGHERVGLAIMDLDGQLRYVRTPDWEVESIALSPKGDRLVYSVNRDGYSDLFLMDTESGEEHAITGLPEGVLSMVSVVADSGLKWDPSGTRLAIAFSGSTHNSDIWLFDAADRTVRRLTRSSTAGIPSSAFTEPELIRYPTFDGRKIPAFFYRPKASGATEPLPVVVSVHGGPESQSRPGFQPLIQYFVNHGYAVFVPNVRGSIGYGKEYRHLDDVRKRMDSVKDLVHGAHWLQAQPGVDPHKIAVMGGSYGGFMVLSAITTYPELWAAGVDIYGIGNFVTFLQNTSAYRRRHREAEYGSLEHDLDFLQEISPINHVHKIKCPLIVVQGKKDPRVPFEESVQIVEKVRAQGGTVEAVYFDDEGHGIAKLGNKLIAYGRIADFLDKHCK